MAFILVALTATVLLGLTAYYGFIADGRSIRKAEWQNWKVDLDQADVRLQNLARRIQSLHGEGRCDHDGQCRVIGLGARGCGYHRDFLVYSTKDAEEASLLKSVAEFNGLHEKLLAMTMVASQCGNKPASVHCVSRHCTPKIPGTVSTLEAGSESRRD